MDYIEARIKVLPASKETNEILIAQLADIGFESFTEDDDGLNAYIKKSEHSDEIIDKLDALFLPHETKIIYQINKIEDQNWNAKWESSFDPIFVADKCVIRASFHKDMPKYDYDIIIDPKMAFGTGHHQTTHLMIEAILNNDFTNKIVLDMGCGTGVLAFLAEMKGAKTITAVDIDEWSYNNTIENSQINGCKRIEPLCGDVRLIEGMTFDIILANINRNILLSDMKHYNQALINGGLLIISGILKGDIEIIQQNASQIGLIHISTSTRDEWVSITYSKPN